MLKFGNKEFRNLQEQVEKNMDDIKFILEEEGVLNEFGIKVVGEVATLADLPTVEEYKEEHEDWAYGDTFAIGTEAPYLLRTLTRKNDGHASDYWFNIGTFPLPGPEGPEGPQGEQGEVGPTALTYASTFVPAEDPVTGATISVTNTSSVFNRTPVVGDYFQLNWFNTYNGKGFLTTVKVKSISGIIVTGEVTKVSGPLNGPQGIQGNQGPVGPQGPQGEQGEQGEPGETITATFSTDPVVGGYTLGSITVEGDTWNIPQGAEVTPEAILEVVEGSASVTVDLNETDDKVQIKLDQDIIDEIDSKQDEITSSNKLSADLVVATNSTTVQANLERIDLEVEGLTDDVADLNTGKLNATKSAISSVGGLVVPTATPTSEELVGIDTDGSQERVTIGNNLTLVDGVLSATGGSTPTNMVTTDTDQTITGKKIINLGNAYSAVIDGQGIFNSFDEDNIEWSTTVGYNPSEGEGIYLDYQKYNESTHQIIIDSSIIANEEGIKLKTTGENKALYNNKEIATVDQISNFVTTDTTQDITGAKTISRSGGLKFRTNSMNGSISIKPSSVGSTLDNFEIALPAKSGTFALTSDIPTDYVVNSDTTGNVQVNVEQDIGIAQMTATGSNGYLGDMFAQVYNDDAENYHVVSSGVDAANPDFDKYSSITADYDIDEDSPSYTILCQDGSNPAVTTESIINGISNAISIGVQSIDNTTYQPIYVNSISLNSNGIGINASDLKLNNVSLKPVSGTNDGTNWTSLTIGTDSYSIPQGGSGSSYTFTNGLTETDGTVSWDLNNRFRDSNTNFYIQTDKNVGDISRMYFSGIYSGTGEPDYGFLMKFPNSVLVSEAFYSFSPTSAIAQPSLGQSGTRWGTLYCNNLSNGTNTATMTNVVTIATPPSSTGTYVLKCIDGVFTWVAE